MSKTTGQGEREYRREELLKLAALAGGAAILGGPAAAIAKAAGTSTTSESGRLQVLDWVGYGNDGGQSRSEERR